MCSSDCSRTIKAPQALTELVGAFLVCTSSPQTTTQSFPEHSAVPTNESSPSSLGLALCFKRYIAHIIENGKSAGMPAHLLRAMAGQQLAFEDDFSRLISSLTEGPQ